MTVIVFFYVNTAWCIFCTPNGNAYRMFKMTYPKKDTFEFKNVFVIWKPLWVITSFLGQEVRWNRTD